MEASSDSLVSFDWTRLMRKIFQLKIFQLKLADKEIRSQALIFHVKILTRILYIKNFRIKKNFGSSSWVNRKLVKSRLATLKKVFYLSLSVRIGTTKKTRQDAN